MSKHLPLLDSALYFSLAVLFSSSNISLQIFTEFVKIVNDPPSTKETLGTNYCLIFPYIEPNSNKLIIISCIDNLVKGTAGQAVQDMNLMFGLNESEGLLDLALYP